MENCTIKQLLVVVSIQLYSIAILAVTPQALPEIFGANNISNVSISSEGTNQKPINNVVLYVTDSTNFTQGGMYKVYPLANSTKLNNGLVVNPYSSEIQDTFLNLTLEQWQAGIYIVPYAVQPEGALIKSIEEFEKSPHATMRVAIFDINWKLLGDGQIGDSKSTANGQATAMNAVPGSMGVLIEGKDVKVNYQDGSRLGNILFLKLGQNIPTPLLSKDMFVVKKPQDTNISAMTLQKGTLNSMIFNLSFGSNNQGAVLLNSSNLKTLNAALGQGSITFNVKLNKNAQSGYNVIINGYQKGELIIEQERINLPLLNSSQQVANTNDFTDLSISYQTNSMQNPMSVDLKNALKFVAVQSGDSLLEATIIADNEKLTSLNFGTVFQSTTGLGGYFEAIASFNANDLAVINNGFMLGQSVVVFANLVGDNVLLQAVSDDKTTVNIKSVQALSNVKIVNAATQKAVDLLPKSRTLVAQNVGYQTNNMMKGIVVPDVAEYKFTSNRSAIIQGMAPSSGTGTGGYTPVPTRSVGGGGSALWA